MHSGYVYCYMVLAMLILAGAFVVMVFSYSGYWLLRNAFSPTKRTRAKILRKRSNQWDVTLMGETPTMQIARLGMLGRYRHEAARAFNRLAGRENVPEVTLAEGVDCYITFGFDGHEMELSVPADLYIACDEGNEGLLVYKGEKFKHFIHHVV